MGHNAKAKKQLLAKAALARSSRASSGSRHSILPKFHCELNFIEFFWGAMKKYL